MATRYAALPLACDRSQVAGARDADGPYVRLTLYGAEESEPAATEDLCLAAAEALGRLLLATVAALRADAANVVPIGALPPDRAAAAPEPRAAATVAILRRAPADPWGFRRWLRPTLVGTIGALALIGLGVLARAMVG